MQYKIISYKKEKYYFQDKADLFNQLDQLDKGYFTDEDFRYSSTGRFIIESKKVSVQSKYDENSYYKETRNITVNALYMVFTEKNVKVDINKLFKEYYQSRNLFNKNRSIYNYNINRGTESYRKRWKAYFKTNKNSFTKEYRDNISAKEQGVKIRTSRDKEVRLKHVFCYEDDLYYRKSKKSWKDYNKNKNQWQKNKSKQ